MKMCAINLKFVFEQTQRLHVLVSRRCSRFSRLQIESVRKLEDVYPRCISFLSFLTIYFKIGSVYDAVLQIYHMLSTEQPEKVFPVCTYIHVI